MEGDWIVFGSYSMYGVVYLQITSSGLESSGLYVLSSGISVPSRIYKWHSGFEWLMPQTCLPRHQNLNHKFPSPHREKNCHISLSRLEWDSVVGSFECISKLT